MKYANLKRDAQNYNALSLTHSKVNSSTTIESNPLEEMMKSFMTQHNPLSRNKKKPNPNKPSKNEQKPE
jgi:hypothetical protein